MSRRQRKGRDIHGILLLDKRTGVSSNGALQEVRRLFQAKKAGHTGSLDPLASGLLPVCFGSATRVSSFLLDTDKQYEVCCQLGQATDTADAEGQVIQSLPVGELNEDILNPVLAGFLGVQFQVPPMYSALKHEGKRLYELARQGVDVERKARQIRIDELELLAYDSAAATITLRVACSKGTYIRSLVEDIARALSTCGHVLTLRRTRVGQFSIHQAITFDELAEMDDSNRQDLLLPTDHALEAWPDIRLDAELARAVRHGQVVTAAAENRAGWVRIYGEGEEFLGIGEVLADGRLAPRRILQAIS